MVSQPKRLRIKLFNHQLASIYQMEKFEKEQRVEPHSIPRDATVQIETKLGINADPTGYGKTLSMIGLIIRDKMSWNMDTPFTSERIVTESAGLVRSRTTMRYTRLPSSLILVSPSILVQWQRELSHTDLCVGTVVTKKDVDSINAEECDVVLITTSMYNYLVRSYPKHAWKRLIFDEPGHARVSGMKEVRAGFYWFVTATPNAINVRHRNCRGSFMKKIIGDNWCDFESQFEHFILRNDENFVKSSFTIPTSQHRFYRCFQPLSNTIAGIVSPQVTMMIEAGNIEGAITVLGGSKTKNLVDLVRRKKLEELEDSKHKIRMYTIREDEEQIKTWTSRKIRVQTQLTELEMRFDNMLSGPCYICREELNNPVLEPSCQNLFCGECLLTWLKRKNTCPTCRSIIQLKDLIYVSSDKAETGLADKGEDLPKTKIEKVIQLIQDNKQGKFLIFSAYDASFEPICRALSENKISYVQLKGSSVSRQRNIDRFKTGEVRAIFLNSNFNGAGINLQETTDLILYHKMSQSASEQILGRAERIGRIEPLRVHHLQVHI